MSFLSPFRNDDPQPHDRLDAETVRLLIEAVQRAFRLTTTHPLHVDINESGFHVWLDQPLSEPEISIYNIITSNNFFTTIINYITEIIFQPGETFNVVNRVCASSLTAQAVGALTTLSGSEQTIVTLNLVTLHPTEALVFGQVDFTANGAAAGDAYAGRLYVDGTLQTLIIPWVVPTTAARANVGQAWKVSLSPGAHTLLLKVLQTSGGGTFAKSGTNTNLAIQTPTAVIAESQAITMATGTVGTAPTCVPTQDCCMTGDGGGGSGDTNCAITCGTAPACGLPNTMVVTVAGLVDGLCLDCDTQNVARTLKLTNPQKCSWAITYDDVCDGTGGETYMNVFYFPPFDLWYCVFYIGSDLAIGTLAGAAWTCNGPNVFAIKLSGPNCTGTVTATVTIPACDQEVIETDCCDPVPTKLCVILTDSGATDGNYDFEWSPIDEVWWNVDAIGTCAAGTISIACDPTEVNLFILTVDGAEYASSADSECNPIYAVFTGVLFTACGGSAGGTVTVTTGACSDNTGTIATNCCPDNLMPSEINLAFDGGVGCSCLTDDYTLTYAANVFSSGINGWGWTDTLCGETVYFIFYCSTSTDSWELRVTVGAQTQTALVTTADCASCSFEFDTFATFSVGSCSPASMSAVVSCGGGGGGTCVPKVATACCPKPLPEVLNFTFTGALAELGTIPLVYGAGGRPGWFATYESATLKVKLEFQCLENKGGIAFRLSVSAGFDGDPIGVCTSFVSAKATTCDPFVWASGAVKLKGNPCNGHDYTATGAC